MGKGLFDEGAMLAAVDEADIDFSITLQRANQRCRLEALRTRTGDDHDERMTKACGESHAESVSAMNRV
jgi:hypothetical protein